jgi:hypothetical protein
VRSPVFFLSLITLGVYPAIWFVRRQKFLDGLHSKQKLAWLPMANLVALLSAIGIGIVLPQIPTQFVGILTILCAFRVAHILRSDFAQTGRFIDVSTIATFFLGVLYLQWIINKAADTPARIARRKKKRRKKRRAALQSSG